MKPTGQPRGYPLPGLPTALNIMCRPLLMKAGRRWSFYLPAGRMPPLTIQLSLQPVKRRRANSAPRASTHRSLSPRSCTILRTGLRPTAWNTSSCSTRTLLGGISVNFASPGTWTTNFLRIPRWNFVVTWSSHVIPMPSSRLTAYRTCSARTRTISLTTAAGYGYETGLDNFC